MRTIGITTGTINTGIMSITATGTVNEAIGRLTITIMNSSGSARSLLKKGTKIRFAVSASIQTCRASSCSRGLRRFLTESKWRKIDIPSVSALESRQSGGQSAGLAAGGNVLTVNFTPDNERENYLIYGKDRYIVRNDHGC
jgi:hypothetical protein